MEGSGKVTPCHTVGSDIGPSTARSPPSLKPAQAQLHTLSPRPKDARQSPGPGISSTKSPGSFAKQRDPMNPGIMPMPGMPTFFPFQPVPDMSMGKSEAKVEGDTADVDSKTASFNNWVMDGMPPLNMMPNMGTSIDGSLMPAMPYAPGTNNAKTGENSSMPMMFFLPMMMEGLPPDFCKDSTGKMVPPPNLMMPMLPFMDEKTALQNLNKLSAPQKTMRPKKPSELDSIKSIPTSVQIRETCQLRAWRRKLQKGRVQQKLDAEIITPPIRQGTTLGTDTKPPEIQQQGDDDTPHLKTKDSSPRTTLSIEMRWHHNRYGPTRSVLEMDLKQLRLFDPNDPEVSEVLGALKRLEKVENRCFPYMSLENFSIPPSNTGKLSLWHEDDDEVSTTQDTGVTQVTQEQPPETAAEEPPDDDISLEDELEMPMEPDENSPSPVPVDIVMEDVEDDFEDALVEDLVATTEAETPEAPPDLMDELEDELLGALSSESNSSGVGGDAIDLDDEFDFDMIEADVAPPPAPPSFPAMQPGLRDTAVTAEPSRIDDGDFFGEVPGTLSHHRANISRLLNAGDAFHEWRAFRSRIGSNIGLTDLVEFEHLWKLFQDKRVEDLYQALGRSPGVPLPLPISEEPGELLYRVGQANLNLLLDFKRPEVQTMVRSANYNLNSTNVIYAPVPTEEDIVPTDEDLLPAEGDEETSFKDDFAAATQEFLEGDVDEESLMFGRDTDVRRNWRRRLQALTKETRLALVNMGKSLRDIENVSSNVEQTRAYDSVVEFCEVAEMFRKRDYISVLNQSFDDYYEKCAPHETDMEGTGSNRRELLNTRIAKNLTGILPLVGKAAKYHNVRFHKPDFRAGLFTEHLRVLRGNYSTEWCAWPARPLLRSALMASFTEESGGAEDVRNHPSNYFLHSSDLTLNDDCKIAILEYVEQHPLLLPNCGMASRIDNYVNYKEEDDPKDLAFLGPLGTLCQASDGIELFGVKHNLVPGDGQTILESTLYKAPIYVHPRPGSDWQNKLNISTTDFLLVRSRANDEVVVRLRPLTWQSGVAVYTVGQCEPKVEVPSPTSKSYVEHTNELLKAWVMKSVMIGSILDIKHLRKEARKKFCPVLSEKDISQMLKQIESTPIFSLRSQALERMIHSTIKPELVCALESVRAGKVRLATMGILHLKSPDNIGAVYSKMQEEERQYQQRQQSMDKRLRELKSSYAKRLEAHGISGEKLEHELKQFDFGLHVSIYGHLEEKTLAPKIRFIKDVLDLTPWNISRDVRHVLNNRGTSQFALYGHADPSGGRGEAINLLKRQVRDAAVDNSNSGEDLRKLSMQELAKRLRCYGVSEDVIKTLPRWDQVALVRQYRDGFGCQVSADGDHRWRIPPEEYQQKLNEILDRQRAALSPDSPIASDSEGGRDVGDSGADGIADALLEGFDEVSDKEDDMERRELEILRQLRETQNAGPISEEERMAEVNKLKAVPGIMWLRQSRRTANEPFGNDRAVFIYGEENVRKLLRWRSQRTSARRGPVQADSSGVTHVGGRRVCRACGQPGHIASNPKCLLYKGDKSRGEHMPSGRGSAVAMAARNKGIRYDSSSDCEITASTVALECDTAESVLRSFDSRYKRRLVYQVSFEESDDGVDSFDEGSLVNSRRKHHRGTVDPSSMPGQNLSSHMEQLMKLVSKAVRIVEKEPRFKPFTCRVPESVAPNYYQIIKNPMWLSLLKSKCKTRCYNDLIQVLDDLALIELNCKQFNSETSPNAWLRKMSEALVDELLMRIQQLTSHLVSPSVIEGVPLVLAALLAQFTPCGCEPSTEKAVETPVHTTPPHEDDHDEDPLKLDTKMEYEPSDAYNGPPDSLDRMDSELFEGEDSFYEEWAEKMEGFHPSSMLSFDIAPKNSEFFYENVRNTGTLLRGMFYTLSKDIELKVHLTIKSPSGEIVFDKESADGIFSFEAKVTGVYTFEFANPLWMTTAGVTVAVGNDEHSVLKSEHIRNTTSRLDTLKSHVDSIYAQFRYLWLHNHRQMRAARDAQTKLLLYSVMQLIIVGVCSLICVTYVKKIVSHKRIL
ncbi:Transcription initiation factor TFIID subunit 1 [Babesia sp. Xinjiang]|uniref:Transcription initiation factor TFIID subunit 1 n=1 Tax=Babesia sp. Xinjiang TaxID=462227 RepID=UPI000A24C37E|nr:Transcription initiation factor TFIID subunit 1 [Babesia sp. Xinjiang]ORM39822.1 Transcription initiation factor TFIID subunit 1 [Babesia sp. Xinjiang]